MSISKLALGTMVMPSGENMKSSSPERKVLWDLPAKVLIITAL